MKQVSLVVMVTLVLVFGIVPICSAERWVPILEQSGVAFYYDADSIGYHRDNLGETPFIHVRVKEVIVFYRDVKSSVHLYVYRSPDQISDDWWRLEDALRQWKQSHPRR